MEPTIIELPLDSQWRLTFTPENIMEDGAPYNVQIRTECLNGDRWEVEITGQVKQDGCADWGGGFPTIHHWCGRKDAELLTMAYDKAVAIMSAMRVE